MQRRKRTIKQKYITAKQEKAKEILADIAGEYEYAYCNSKTKWFERICEKNGINPDDFG